VSHINQIVQNFVRLTIDSFLDTQSVGEYCFMFTPTMRVHLIDTPGFDDTDRKDTEVLRDVAGWLGIAYKKKIYLSGIIYLHRIIDVRMQGTAKRNLFMFQKLCGDRCFPQIALATTMWTMVPPDMGTERERELIDTEDFWGYMYQRGSQILRHHNNQDRSSALAILDAVIRRRKKVTLQIQREMKDGLELDETDAGKQLNADIIKEREHHKRAMRDLEEDMQEALRRKDEQMASQIAEMQAETAAKIQAGEESQKRLRIDLEKLQADREAEYKQLQEKLQEQVALLKEQEDRYSVLMKSSSENQRGMEEELLRLKADLQQTTEELRNTYSTMTQKSSGP
jgi:hypothetical protein